MSDIPEIPENSLLNYIPLSLRYFDSVDQYCHILGFFLVILVIIIYKGYEVYCYRTGEMKRYKAFFDDVQFSQPAERKRSMVSQISQITDRKKSSAFDELYGI